MSENQTGAIAKMMEMGGAVGAVTGGEKFSASPYVMFASPKSNNWAQMMMKVPGLNDGDPLLIRPDPYPPLKLTPLTFFLYAAERFYCIRDQGDFSLLEAHKAEQPDTKEEIHSLIIVVMPDGGFVPATCSFRTTKVQAVKSAARALELCVKPDWANISPAHRATLEIATPWMRFMTTATMAPRTAQSGFKYVAAKGTTSPTPKGMADQLNAWLADPANQKDMEAVSNAYNFRLSDYTNALK